MINWGAIIITTDWNHWIEQRLIGWEKSGVRRILRPIKQGTEPLVLFNDQELINFSSNNYLGLANHPTIISAMKAGLQGGAGLASSRSLLGHTPEIAELEANLAIYHRKEAALFFANGYLANLGVLSTFLSHHDLVFSDRYNHASIVDGIRLSQAQHIRYRHNDLDHLTYLLQKYETSKQKKWLITDSLFSMDGDFANIPEIIALKERYAFALMVDEAHAGGVFGPRGEGLAAHVGQQEMIDLHMGTFSKAFGLYGAYVTGKKKWIDYLIHACRSFIYTTALPPLIIAGISQALPLIQTATTQREKLIAISTYFRQRLQSMGFDTLESASQIVPVIIGDERLTTLFSQRLQERGVYCLPIRTPTVPLKKARLRFSLLANHERSHIESALTAIQQVGKELEVI